jgi:hypothetical protein
LFSIGTITFSQETVSLLNVGILKIRSTKKFDSKQRTFDQTTAKVVPSTVKLKDFSVNKPPKFQES